MSLVVEIRKEYPSFCLDVRLQASEGVTGILGPSGCGKSMTLRCIAGVEKPDAGRIVLDGVTLFDSEKGIDLRPQQRQVGYLFQNCALFPNMTLRQNILCSLRQEKDRTQRERVLQRQIELLQLQGLEDRYPAQLSGGQQQRAALARILAGSPKLLMLDEPFSALDAHLRDRLLVEMKSVLLQYGGTTLAVTHSRDEAYSLSDSIALMEDGRVFTHKPTKALFADPETVTGAVLTGCKNIAPAESVDAHTVRVPAWGTCLKTAQPLREGLQAVGIRAHDFHLAGGENRFPVRITEIVEEPFALILQFRFDTQAPDAPPLWWRLPKQLCPKQAAVGTGFFLSVDSSAVLPLYAPGR